MARPLAGLDAKRLRRWLLLFFLALAVPTGVLVRQAYSQLKWEAFHQHQVLAQELALRIDASARSLLQAEEERGFTDYAFLTLSGDPAANYLQPSPLSRLPAESPVPGLIGYFQVDAGGRFSTPLLPARESSAADYGVSAPERRERAELQARIHRILSDNRLVQGGRADTGEIALAAPTSPDFELEEADGALVLGDEAPRSAPAPVPASAAAAAPEFAATETSAQAAFDQLGEALSFGSRQKKEGGPESLGRVEELKLRQKYVDAPEPSAAAPPAAASKARRSPRRERGMLPAAPAVTAEAAAELRLSTFESELDPFELSLLDSGHLVLFRKVWRDGQRYIQGLLLERQGFLEGLTAEPFRAAAVSRMSELVVAYQGEVFAVLAGQGERQYLSRASELRGELLYQARLSAPLDQLELIFSINRLPAGPGGRLVTWVSVILTLVLCGGFWLLYRLGLKQIELARQQQDFVSAVSHELKTPLTSIRMYGEMLREGWAPEDKKQTYYGYIHDESERLSRLIANVLQLARMTRNDLRLEPRNVEVSALMKQVAAKVASQIERAGFEWQIDCPGPAARARVEVDEDGFAQILINLVDNALKFSAKAERKRIELRCRLAGRGLELSLRDYGPGVERNQMKKIFRLFYRSENELTRETLGTGIGLALVRQLAQSMGGRVDVRNADPGAEFRLWLPLAEGPK
jgi:signal transduction histidine kinase